MCKTNWPSLTDRRSTDVHKRECVYKLNSYTYGFCYTHGWHYYWTERARMEKLNQIKKIIQKQYLHYVERTDFSTASGRMSCRAAVTRNVLRFFPTPITTIHIHDTDITDLYIGVCIYIIIIMISLGFKMAYYG